MLILLYLLALILVDSYDPVNPVEDVLQVLLGPLLRLDKLPGGHGYRLPRELLNQRLQHQPIIEITLGAIDLD